MSTDYNPHTIEQEAQAFWEKNRCFNVEKKDPHSEKFYNLCAFPYPSGELHVGHVRNYVLGDVIARYQRMCGKQVIYPTGWDAFGLPAENAAIAKGVDPRKWTEANIERMRAQFKRLGLSYDWDRELMTCDPNYYQWEQWLFIKLFEKGLAYRKTSWVNWDPVDQTILANEQVIQGRGWRSNALVERKAISQWFLKITDYTETLLKDLETLKEWPESVKTMQHHWIGRSEGVMVQFKLNSSNPSTFEVFTTRVDTLMGVTYIAISCEHPLAQEAAEKDSKIQAFIEKCLTVPTAEAEAAAQEKMGAFTGFYAEHPILKTSLPIWIANFVEMDYGSGAVMAVPAHDTRDFEFAKKYQLSIQPVIAPLHTDELHDYTEAAYTKQGTLIHSGAFTGLDTKTATQTITEHLIAHQLGYLKTHYRLKDWGISRQRYWGAPIPIIYCNTCGTLAAPLEDLPIKLPKLDAHERGKAPPPLSQIPEFFETTCPKCQGPARRETDTFDTFVESSWYFIRFLCPHASEMVTPEAQSWLPVDHYIIGIEHAVLHLLYSRFFYRLLHTLDLLQSTPKAPQEPFKAVLTLGMVLKDGAKMSKSKGNIVSPDTLIDQYGVDTLRLFILFAAPPTQSLEWSDDGLLGGARFLKRLWHFVEVHKTWLTTLDITNKPLTTEQKALRTQIHTLLQSALQDYNRYQFNTVIASCMKLLNTLQNAISDLSSLDSVERQTWLAIIQEGLSILLRLLAPVVPHITHTLWVKLNQPGIILDAPWPIIDQAALYKKEVSFIIQINGKRRGVLTVDANTSSEQLTQIALQSDKIKPYLEKMSVKKTILVPAKPNAPLLMNIVAVEQIA